jgi:general secretion pathway protein K
VNVGLRRQRGIALIQVLLITALVLLMVGQFALTAKDQVQRAQLLADRAAVELEAVSVEADLGYALLTTDWTSTGAALPSATAASPAVGASGETDAAAESGGEPASSPAAITAAWNFVGQPFRIGDATIRIADESGKLQVPMYDAADFVRLVEALGVPAARAERLGRQLLEHQGTFRGPSLPRAAPAATGPAGLERYVAGFPMQTLEELRDLPDMDEPLFARLRERLTVYPTPGLNPLTAEPEVLATRLPATQVAGIVESRARGALGAREFRRASGIDADEATVLWPGPAFALEIAVSRGGVEVHRRALLVARPYQNEALALWARQ